jgi:capsular exopolysaccharide synthesis family protein
MAEESERLGGRRYAAEPVSPSEERTEGGFSLVELWLAVRNNLWLVLGIALAALGASAYYTSTRTRLYSASATVRFDPQAPRVLGQQVENVADIQSDYWNRQEYYNTQHWQLRSKGTALPVVRELALHKNIGFVMRRPSDALAPEELVSEEAAASMLSARLDVRGIDESRLATVSYTDANPERAARVLSAVLRAYIEQHRAEQRSVSEEASQWLGDQVQALKQRLEESEHELYEYRKEKDILDVSADDQSEMLGSSMQQLTTELTAAEARRAKIGARRSELRKVGSDDPERLPVAELMDSTVLSQLREKYVVASAELDSLVGAGKGTNHPDVASVRARRDAARRLLLAEVENVKESVEKDYAAASQEISALSALLADARKKALELNKLAIDYKRLERQRDTNEKLFGLVTERSKETDLTRMLAPSNTKVVDPPEVPGAPFSPNVPLNLMAGLMLGLALGLVVAIGREQFDASVRRPEVLEQATGAPFLGLLPLVKRGETKRGFSPLAFLRRKRARSPAQLGSQPATPSGERARRSELTVHYDPQSGMAESARAIRTNLLLSDVPTQTLLVTSSAPGDGKTTVACSLAISLASAGQRVCLVDADLRRPRLHRIFGVPNDLGLTSAVAGGHPLGELLRPTLVTGLSLLPAGHLPAHPAELLHSERFAELLHELRERFDRVVFDSPPLIPVTDGAVLASQLDATVLVARAFGSKKHTVRRSARILRDVDANVVGAVLNAVDFDRGEYRYYQYYDYARHGAAHSVPPPSRG